MFEAIKGEGLSETFEMMHILQRMETRKSFTLCLNGNSWVHPMELAVGRFKRNKENISSHSHN